MNLKINDLEKSQKIDNLMPKAFPVYFTNKFPGGAQIIKCESPTVQVYLSVRKIKINGEMCYHYNLERMLLEHSNWMDLLKNYSSGTEQEYLSLLAEAASFFIRVEAKLKSVTV
jgi:hypothetical protein